MAAKDRKSKKQADNDANEAKKSGANDADEKAPGAARDSDEDDEKDFVFEDDDMTPREGPLKALRDFIIIGAIMGGLVYGYNMKVEKDKALNAAQTKGRAYMKVDSILGYQKAIESWDEALALMPENPLSISSKALAQLRLWGAYGIEKYKAGALDGARAAAATNAPISERYAAEALAALYQGKADDAFNKMKSVVAKGGSSPLILGVVGEIELTRGKGEEALQSLQKAHDLEWDYPGWARDIGLVYLRRGDFDNAGTFFTKALNIRKDYTWSVVDKSLVEIRQGDKTDSAIKKINDALEEGEALGPHLQSYATFVRAWGHFAKNEHDKALETLAKSMSSRPNIAAHHALKGKILSKKGESAQAVSELTKAIELDARIAEYHFDLVRAQLGAKNKDAALQTLDNYKKHLPENGGFHLASARVFVDIEDFERAFKHIEEASKQEGWNAEVFYTKGLALQKQKKFKEAAEAYEEAIGIQEVYPEVYHQVCLMFRDQGYGEDALTQCAQAGRYYLQVSAPRTQLAGLYDDMAGIYRKMRKKKEAKEMEDMRDQLIGVPQ